VIAVTGEACLSGARGCAPAVTGCPGEVLLRCQAGPGSQTIVPNTRSVWAGGPTSLGGRVTRGIGALPCACPPLPTPVSVCRAHSEPHLRFAGHSRAWRQPSLQRPLSPEASAPSGVGPARAPAPLPGKHACHRITEPWRLEKTSKLIESNRHPNTTVPAKPCPQVPHLHIF